MNIRDQFQFLSSKLHCEVKHLVLDKVIAQMDTIILKQVCLQYLCAYLQRSVHSFPLFISAILCLCA